MAVMAKRATLILQKLIKAGLSSGVYAAMALLGGGDPAWQRGWLFTAVFIGAAMLGGLIVQLKNPDLVAARAKGLREDTKPFDKMFYRLFLPLIFLYPLLAGLDAARFGWAPLPWWTFYPGLVLFLASSCLTTWTMLANTYAETTVRIQTDRGHSVVRHGPYAFIRHPMYAGIILGLPGTSLMLGSGWGLVPAFLTAPLFVWRTAKEDQTLREELPGYGAYAESTRYRLLPGVW